MATYIHKCTQHDSFIACQDAMQTYGKIFEKWEECADHFYPYYRHCSKKGVLESVRAVYSHLQITKSRGRIIAEIPDYGTVDAYLRST